SGLSTTSVALAHMRDNVEILLRSTVGNAIAHCTESERAGSSARDRRSERCQRRRAEMKKVRWLVTVLTVVALIPAPAAAGQAGPADLSKLVVIGDSLSAGFQNSSLLGSQQPHGYASLIAAQAGVSLPLPLIAAPGIPSVLELVSVGPPLIIDQAPGLSTGRLDPLLPVMDLAVPGATVADALTLVPDCDFTPANAPPIKQVVNVLTDFILGLPGCFSNTRMSQVQWAEAVSPTTVLVWLGNQDALQAVIYGADP